MYFGLCVGYVLLMSHITIKQHQRLVFLFSFGLNDEGKNSNI